ncbi:hypothetical protein ACUXJ3_000825 [Staphylococcus capitis]|uniref:hypothetical protein n=1 Tax=Staphylococcus pettenkoferi TaxID=170573 RepID=UPI0011A93BB5|nr:hypothetical protein [Staphylococcus pettenkoferi]
MVITILSMIGSPAFKAFKEIENSRPELSKEFGINNFKGVEAINIPSAVKEQARFARKFAKDANIGNYIALLYSNV